MNSGDLPAIIAGRYRPIRLVGKGGMGAVYEVEHVHTGQRLALKILTITATGEAVERFKREARASSRIKSDHVVRITDADVAPELDGAPFLVMELLDGMDLEVATANGAVAPTDVVTWLDQIARALTRAHELGIVHRDLKPENLFLTQRDDGTPLVKILDFGIAKILADGQKTQSGQVLGTPLYMAPEQANPSAAAPTAQTDLFTLGLIAHRLLVGKPYWKDGSIAQLITQLLYEPMVAPSTRGCTLGPRFDEWFGRACAREPEKRFPSAQEEVAALAVALGVELVRPALAESRPTATPASQPKISTLEGASTVASAPKPPRWRLAVLALGLVAVATGIGIFLRRENPARTSATTRLDITADGPSTRTTPVSSPITTRAVETAPVTGASAIPPTTSEKKTERVDAHRVTPTLSASAPSAKPVRSADPLGDPY